MLIKDSQKLANIRKKIDQTNQKLIKLLEKRLSLALSALAYKKKILDKKREQEILKAIPSPYLKAIFRQILACTKKEQLKQKNKKTQKAPKRKTI